ncbi:outer membrane beta-barrel protein [Ancylobacter sp. 6x-1]|uniref:Outer membrane beta-barrel protein n=1 Tax=Ancylobacter crimeensis TaxID=2579147 RepID=A0ABT0D9Q9_9HYPH|nr:outer membrane beta-barrel protein [Ancylobacter crimeensis]MCK0196696.1 outer membrane beta-barrel protein [Ancylobacter crimeensis]
MNTRYLTGFVVAAAMAAAAPAFAADLSYPAPAYAQPAYAAPFTWSGFYVGANGGYGWGNVDHGGKPDGGIVGGQLGFNWQGASPIVLGFETDLQYSAMESGPYSLDYFGTARLRAGYAINQLLIYGTGGLAYGGGEYKLGGLSSDKSHIGWALGAGAEYAINQNWSVKGEYLRIDLSSETYSSVEGPQDIGVTGNLLRAGVNYRF